MDKNRVEKLLEIASPEDRAALTTLYNASISTLNSYQAEANSGRLRNWKSADDALDARVHEMEEKYSGRRWYKTIAAVVEYLTENRWDVKKSTVYADVKKGLLRADENGMFSDSRVDAYAGKRLKKLGDVTAPSEDESERNTYELRKLKAEMELKEIAARRANGAVVDKGEFNRKLALRARLLKSDLNQFSLSRGPEICGVVSGDDTMIPDLIVYLQNEFKKFLGRYADSDHHWEAPPDDPEQKAS